MTEGLLNRLVIPLLCGAAGGGITALVLRPEPAAARAEAAATPPDDCRALRDEVRSLGRGLEQLQLARPVSTDGGAGLAAMPAELLAEIEQSRDRAKSSRETFEGAMAERAKKLATQDVAERRTIQKNTTEEQTQKNVRMWINRLGFAPEDQQKVAELAAPYVRRREEAILAALEQASKGTPVAPDALDHQLDTMKSNFKASLPPDLDPDARIAVVKAVHSRISVPYYLGKH